MIAAESRSLMVITRAPMGFTMATFIMNVERGKNSTARYDQ
jgi:hypothetical protein